MKVLTGDGISDATSLEFLQNDTRRDRAMAFGSAPRLAVAVAGHVSDELLWKTSAVRRLTRPLARVKLS
jgi:hypothetical protein